MPAYQLVSSHPRASAYSATFTADAAADTAGEEAEALAFTTTGVSPDFEYSATAENPGSTGEMDLQPGLIYKGEVTRPAMVRVDALSLSGGTITPEATDTIVAGIFKNGELVATLDNESETDAAESAYAIDELDTATAVMKGGTIVDAVAPGDVIRVGLLGLGDETVQTAVAAGGAVSVS